MPAKKRVKRKSSKKVKKSTEKSAGSMKTNVVVWNLILFAILSIASYLLYRVSGSEFYKDLFFLLCVVLGFVALAFLIAFLVMFLLKVKK